jgi:hypothetical protein
MVLMTSPRPASRPRRRTIDVRLLVGVGLVVASVAGVLGIVTTMDKRVGVYVAGSTFAPGDRIDAGDLLEREVALDDAGGLYLGVGAIPDGGLIVDSVVRRGELVPLSSIGTTQGRQATAIVLTLTTPASAAVVAGARVDVWSAPADSGGEPSASGGFGPPAVLTPDAVVVRVVEESGIVTASDGEAIEVLVPRTKVARLLQAIANGDAIAVVPAGLPLAQP